MKLTRTHVELLFMCAPFTEDGSHLFNVYYLFIFFHLFIAEPMASEIFPPSWSLCTAILEADFFPAIVLITELS